MMKTKLTFILPLFFLTQFLFAQNKATIIEESREMITYPYGDPNPITILTGKNFKIYPYFSFDGFTETLRKQKWKVIKLENDYIKVFIMPEIGGKIWGAIEKSTGKEFIYNNDVVKFRDISMRGPWTSGGIEYNFGLIGHSPATASPVDYLTRENADGSVSCFLSNLDLPSRTQWSVEVRLSKDHAYFETIPLWTNPTPLSQSYYCFMTGAAAVTDDLEFFYPGNQALEHEGQVKPYPVQNGHNKSIYPANAYASHTSIHVVGDYNDFMGGYYHKSEFGFGHWALYNDMPGRKLWLWALSREGEIWKDLLTDKHGQYLEFQAGRSLNQYSQSSFRSPIKEMPFNPGITDQWKEIWFPVKDIGGLTEVSPMGVLNAKQENGKLEIGINALTFVNAKLVVTSGEKMIYTEDKKFRPMDVYKTSIPLDENAPYQVKIEGMDLVHNSVNKNLIKRPFATSIPPQATSAASLFQDGIQLKENRNYEPAKKSLLQCLKTDPLYIDAMAALVEIYYRSNQLDSALYYANRALQLDTYHPAANYYAGITYRAQGDLINALESLGWATRSMEFRSEAYALMAGIELQLTDLSLAEQYANQSLDFNRFNFNAMKVLTIVYRQKGNLDLASKMLEKIVALDPLNHFAGFERYLLHPSSENLSLFKSAIRNELPYQTYLELAIDYYDLGQKEDALHVLENAPDQPMVLLWKAFLKDEPTLLTEIAKESPAFVFPYRTETVSALTWAVANSDNWKYKYYLGLNMWGIQREDDARKLFQECQQDPDFPAFYLSRADLEKQTDQKLELSDLRKAYQLAPEDWRSSNQLIEALISREDYKAALPLSSEAKKKFPDNYNLALQYARVQLGNNQYETCLKTLEKTHILPFEGSIQGKYVYEQAYILLAIDLIKNKRYKEALVKLEKSKAWPENLGVGAPYEPDNRLQDYLEAICQDKLGNVKEAKVLRDVVLEFTKTHYGDFMPTFNNIFALTILQQRGEADEASSLIEKIKTSDQYINPIQKWVVAYFMKDTVTCDQIEKDIAKNRYYSIIKSLLIQL
jgi:tetratricopeptide (TPR) repeat protein